MGASIGEPIAKPAFLAGFLFKFREGTMNTKFADRVFRILFIFVFIMGMVWTPGMGVAAQEPLPNPQVKANPDNDEVQAGGWPNGTQITLTIDDPTNGVGTDYSTTVPIAPLQWDPNQQIALFQLQGLFDIRPGHIITVTGEGQSKTMTVADIWGISVDVDADTVSGYITAGSSASVHVGVNIDSGNLPVDENGYWIADLSIVGTDIKPGTRGYVQVDGQDGSVTWVSFQVLNPAITAAPSNDWISGEEWPINATVTIEIDDPATPDNPDFSITQIATAEAEWRPNKPGGYFQYWSEYDFSAGDTITLSDGITTKSLVVSGVQITTIDVDNDVIAGVTAPDRNMWVFVSGIDGVMREIVSDSSGNWSVEFTGYYDIQPGTEGSLKVFDGDQDMTHVDWRVPNPRFSVQFPWNEVHGYEWPMGANVALTIDDPSNGQGVDYSQTKTVGTDNFRPPFDTWIGFQLVDFTVKPGDIVTMTDGTTTKTHVTQELTVTNVDPAADTVSGTAAAGTDVQFGGVCNNNGCAYRRVSADASGHWLADFSVPGEDGNEQQIFDLGPGSSGEAQRIDNDGDGTVYQWNLLQPVIWAHPNDSEEDWIDGRDWKFGETVQLTIDNDTDPSNGILYTDSGVVGPANWNPSVGIKEFHLGNFDLKPGHIVTLTSATTTKVLTITDINVTDINPNLNTISGTAVAGSAVQAWQHEEPHCNFEMITDGNGFWTVDFSQCNFGPGVGGGVGQKDADEDSTVYFWNVPNPRIFALLGDQRVHAWGWPAGTLLTLTIENPATQQSPDYSGTQVATAFEDWDHGFEWGITFEIQPGYVVTVSGGGLTKQLTVAPLSVTNVDIVEDTVSGTGNPGYEIHVGMLCDDNSCTRRNIYVDANGNWFADFSVPGNNEEETVFDIRPGSGTGVYQIDEDNDATNVGWNVPNYSLHAVPAHPEVHGHSWPLDADVTLTIDNDTNPNNGTLYTRTKNVSDDPWCGEPCFDLLGVFDLEVGQYVTMTDGSYTSAVHVSVLKITEVNSDNDTVSGIADPGSRVAVNIWSQDGKARYVTVDQNGNWVADFSVFGDEDFEQFTTDIRYGDNGRAIQLNPDGTDDGTLEYWNAPRPRPYYIKASPTEDWVHARGWANGATLTLTVDDPNTPQPVDYTSTTSMAPASWDPGDQDDFIGIFDLKGAYDLQAGCTVTITDGTTSLSAVVTDLTQIRWFESLMGYDAVHVANEQVIVDEFNMTHPQIELLLESASSDGKAVFENEITTGNGPDIVGLVGWGAASDFHGQWLDLEPLIQSSGYDTSVFTAKALESYQTDEGQVALPFALYPSAVFYQRALFDAAGLNYPPANYGDPYLWPNGTQTVWNFNTLTQVAKLLTLDANGHNATETGFNRNNIVQYGYVPQWQHPKEMASYWKADDMYDGTPGNYTAVIPNEWSSVWEWYYNGMWGAEPFIPASPQIGNLGGGNAFDSGKVAMAISHTWYTCCMGNAGTNWDLATLPSYNGNVHNPIHADTFRIWKGTQHATEAFQVLTYLLGDASQVLLDLWSGGAAISARTADQGTFLTSRATAYPWVTNWDVMVDGLQYIEKPSHEDFMPNRTEAWNRMQTFGDLLSNQSGLNVNQEIITLKNDLTSIFNYGRLLTPFVEAAPYSDWIHARDWPLGTSITLTIDDPSDGTGDVDYTATDTIHQAPWNPGDPNDILAEFNWPDQFAPGSGYVITASGNGLSKTLTVSQLKATDLDVDADTISGIGTPGVQVQVCANVPNNCITRWVTPDASGNWTANYHTPGTGNDDLSTFDVQNGSNGWAADYEADSDRTWYDWNVPNPSFGARANDDRIEGWQWPVGATVTVEIDDPAVAGAVNYTGQADVYIPDWNPNETRFELNFNGEYDLKPGDIVKVTDGTTTKRLAVTNFALVEINPGTDMVYGHANSNTQINVWACDNTHCVNREETSNQSGNWQSNFSVHGDLDWEQDTFNIQPGTWVDSSQNDVDGDGTFFGRNAGSTISGTVYAVAVAPENKIAGVMIEACTTDNFCKTALTGGDGIYWLGGLQAGTYTLRALSPGSNLPGSLGPIDISYDETLSGQDITVPAPPLPPPPDAIEPAHSGGGTTVVYWRDDLTLTAHGCAGGTATYELTVLEDGYTIIGPMTETSANPGTYLAGIPSLYPHHGVTLIEYTITCPGGGTEKIEFPIYIDPSGFVKDTSGNPIADATVTLFYADNPDGPFTEVPDGSVQMSASNRKNPDTTNESGQFGWDVVAGFYKVRAEKAGCYSPSDPLQLFVESAVLTIPPPVTGLELILECPAPKDTTPPEISAVLNGTVGTHGWYTSNVTVNWNVDDSESGIASSNGCDTITLTSDSMGEVLTCSAENGAGLANSASVTVKIDKTAPTVTWAGSIKNGDSFYFGFVPPAPTCMAGDEFSGVDGSCAVIGYVPTVGTHTLIATAKDMAGNQTIETRNYTVLGWTLKGFYQPVDMNGTYNVVKGGSTVPLKFEVFAGFTELTDVAAIKSLTSAETTCNANAVTDEIELTATGGTSLRYADGQFIYNWKTPKTAGKCYRVTMLTMDGSSLAAYFKLK
jgi:multiple sugar transport system substrate-binding protein